MFTFVVGVVGISKTLISFILVLGVLIFAHEFGHYIVAKWTGVRVEEFALGFGPKLIKYKKGETLYSIRIFPLGGFCKLTGEFPHAEEDLEGEELETYRDAVQKGRALYQKSILQRFGVFFTGPLMNFVLAAVVIAIVFIAVGIPNTASNEPVIGEVGLEQPAYNAGLKKNDRILAIDGKKVNTWEDISRLISQSQNESVEIMIERDGKEKLYKIKPAYDQQEDRRIIGIWPKIFSEKVGVGTAIWTAILETFYMIKTLIVGFWQMITFQVSADVGGPVLIAKMVGEAAEVGWVYLLRLTALLSINLGIINLIPFPALDGGRILFLGIELIRGKKVDPEKEGIVHFIGFVILMALIVLIIYRDIVRIF